MQSRAQKSLNRLKSFYLFEPRCKAHYGLVKIHNSKYSPVSHEQIPKAGFGGALKKLESTSENDQDFENLFLNQYTDEDQFMDEYFL